MSFKQVNIRRYYYYMIFFFLLNVCLCERRDTLIGNEGKTIKKREISQYKTGEKKLVAINSGLQIGQKRVTGLVTSFNRT